MSRILVFVLLLGVAAPVLAADEVKDLAKDAVDPYNPGGERARFLAAAGIDSELSEDEFKANAEASDPFVRPFDKWSTLKAFDKNANGKVDWFEADGYRRAVRKAVLGTFDKNDNTRLQGEERTSANEALASGKLPRVALPSREAPRPSTRPDNNNPRPDNNSPNRPSNDDRRQRYEQMRAEFLKKYDEDGNGELSREEREKGFRAERERRLAEWKERDPEGYANYMKRREEEAARRKELIEKYDKDGDGDLNRDERMAAWKDRDPEGYERYQKRREEMLKKHDKDGDGEFNDEERRAAYEDMRNQFRQQYEALVKEHDSDNDGRLSREEREAAIKKYEDAGEDVPRALRWDPRRRGRGGPSDRGRGGPDRGRGGPDRGDRNRDNDA